MKSDFEKYVDKANKKRNPINEGWRNDDYSGGYGDEEEREMRESRMASIQFFVEEKLMDLGSLSIDQMDQIINCFERVFGS